MADFSAPDGPPPPKVPEGWKAVWNAQYKEWFYVNTHTKKSQWDRPTEPVYPPNEGTADVPPPAYDPSSAPPVAPEKSGGLTGEKTGASGSLSPRIGSNNPYAHGNSGAEQLTSDEALARRLQDEENARMGGLKQGDKKERGESDSYYGANNAPGFQQQQFASGPSGYSDPNQSADKGKSKGIFSKLLGKNRPPQQLHHQQQQHYQPQGYPQQQQQYYGAPPAGYGYPQGGGYQQYGPPMGVGGRRPGGGGMGTAGAAALGVGGGLLGGALLADAFDGHHGGDDGYGGDDGGGDDGGWGGDDGGGDFGGGDF